MRMRADNNRLNWGDVGEQHALLTKLGKPTCSCTAFNTIGCPLHDSDVATAREAREARYTQSRYTVQDEREQLHYYMDLKQYMPSANQLRFIGSVEEIQVKDSNLVPAFTHIRK